MWHEKKLNNNTVAVVDFVLDDLSSPVLEGFDSGLEGFVLVFDFDGFETFGGASAFQGEATFFGLEGVGLFDDFGVEHEGWGGVVLEYDDIFGDADHICG